MSRSIDFLEAMTMEFLSYKWKSTNSIPSSAEEAQRLEKEAIAEMKKFTNLACVAFNRDSHYAGSVPEDTSLATELARLGYTKYE